MDKAGKDNILGCFQSTSRKFLKRKRSEKNETQSKSDSVAKRPAFNNPLYSQGLLGEANHTEEISWNSPKPSGRAFGFEDDAPAKKRVKFDEENLICSSITYQRHQEETRQATKQESKSLLKKIIDFTAGLF